MKIQVTFDVHGYVNEWHFANYLAEMLLTPEEPDIDVYSVQGIDDVKIIKENGVQDQAG